MLAVAARETSTIKLGHFVTNPATRDPTVLASSYATLHDLSDGRMVMGVGRGDSAVRYIGRQPMKVAEFEAVARDDARVHERPRGQLERQGPPAQVGARGAAADPRLGRGLRAEGARGRGPRRRRRDHPARRSRDHPVDHGHGPARGRGGRPRPGAAQVHRRRAGAHLRRPRRRARAGALVPGHGLEPRHGPDRAGTAPTGPSSRRRSPTTSRRGSSTTTTTTRASARRTASSSPTRSATASASSARSSRRRRSCASSRRSASTSSTSTS